MADKAKGYGSVKRFGVRYGTKLKGKIGKIEAERRLSTKCPYCHYRKAKRLATGIWFCQKCKSRFTGKAYSLGGPVVIKEEVTETISEAAEAPEKAEGAEGEELETVEQTEEEGA